MTAASPPRPSLPALVLPKLPFADRLQSLAYSVGSTQVAVGITSAIYVLVTQARYFGHSFKHTWDHLDTLWFHVQGVPLIGGWLVSHWKIFEHVFLRDAPESILAYAFVVMLLLKQPNLKSKVPWVDRVFVKLHVPSPYQERYGRHDRVSVPQLLLLPVTMLLTAIPGEALASAGAFGGIALAHKFGYQAPWLDPNAGWVPIVIGVAGGAFWGHRPAVKVGRDVQVYWLERRIAATYYAESVMVAYKDGTMDQFKARDVLTSLPRTKPAWYYPPVFRRWYEELIKRRVTVQAHGKGVKTAMAAVGPILLVLALYGLYVRKIGVPMGHFWMP